jgi:signal transduction histidine kinase
MAGGFLAGLALALAAGWADAQTNSLTPSYRVILLESTNGLGDWIWAGQTFDYQVCRLWRSFEIPLHADVSLARLRITADNGYRVFLDGREVGSGHNWRFVTEYDLTSLLQPGLHVLGVEAFNEEREAGVTVGFNVDFSDGTGFYLGSDRTWRLVPESDKGWLTRSQPDNRWKAAEIVAPMGGRPWRILKNIVVAPPLRPFALWQRGWFQIALLGLCGVIMLICLRLTARLAMQAKAQRLLQVERVRIARDIHDDLGSGLTQLILRGEVAQSDLPADSKARAEIDELCEQARSLSRAMDEIVWAVNSRRDTLRDFITHMCKYSRSLLCTTSIRCRFDIDTEIPEVAFDLPIRRNLFLAVKEALHNAVKHSGAGELYLRIHKHEQGLVVIVEDDGRGFDLTQASPERNGLTNMSQRMTEVGGACRVHGQKQGGCAVEFSVPHLQLRRPLPWVDGMWRWARRLTPGGRPKQLQQDL